jgi:hypothetical protein
VAVMALLNEYLTINSVNLSDHMKQATLTVDSAQLDPTAMGDGWVRAAGGLKSGQLQVEWLDDFVAASVDATLWPLLGTVTTFELRPDGGSVGASNPKYTGSLFVAQIVVGGSLGELAMKSLTFPTSGAITRATS